MDRTANAIGARLFASLIALTAWAGLIVQFSASLEMLGSVASTLWRMLLFFTVLANLMVAILFAGIALNQKAFSRAPLVSGITLAMLLVGIVYGLLLRGLVELSGGAVLADFLLHKVTPVLTLAYWILCIPKGELQSRHPWVWIAFPFAYFIYGLIRGAIEGLYPYPFMNAAQIGWAVTALNGILMALGFLAVGYAMIWVDARLGKPRDGGNETGK